jgi:hypothetical protein
LNNFYCDGFVTDEGIDPSSNVDVDIPNKRVLTPSSFSSKTFGLNFSPEYWNFKSILGNIAYWISDSGSSGHFESGNKYISGSAVDKGNGKVGFPCSSHGLSTNQVVSVYGTVNYDGTYVVDSTSSTNEIVVAVTYISETFSSSFIRQRVRLGTSGDNTLIEKGSCVEFADTVLYVLRIDGDGSGDSGVVLSEAHTSGEILSIRQVRFDNGSVGSSYFWSDSVKTWTYLSLDNSPPPRSGSPLVYDVVGKQVFLFGGGSDSTVLSDTWKFDVVQQSWTHLFPSTSPDGRRAHSLLYDSENRYLWLFGGQTASGAFLNDLWRYNISTNVWTQMSPTGGPPTARCYHCAFYSDIDKVMVISHGKTGDSETNDAWKYTVATNAWASISLSGNPAARHGTSASFDVHNDIVYYFAGLVSGSYSATIFYWTIDSLACHTYSSAKDNGRCYHSSVFNPFENSLIIYGGNVSQGKVLDTFNYIPLLNVINSDYIEEDYCQDHGACFDMENGQMIVFGGYDFEGLSAGNTTRIYTNRHYAHSKSLAVIYTNDKNNLGLKNVLSLTGSYITQVTPYKSKIFYAVSFDSRQTWKIFTDYSWRDIVRYYGGSWQYKDASNAWVNASDLQTSLELAFSITANQWTTSPDFRETSSITTTTPIPAMTSNTAPSPYVASVSSEYSATYTAWYVFNKSASNYWRSATNQVADQWVQIDVGSGNEFAARKWRWRSDNTTYSPKRFKLQGSNNGSSWTDLETSYSAVDYPQPGTEVYSPWLFFTNNVKYRYYRMYIISGYSTSSVYVDEVDIVDSASSALVPGTECLDPTRWSLTNGFSAGTSTALDVALGFQASDYGVPSLSQLEILSSISSSDMTLITKSWDASLNNPTYAFCVFQIDSMETLVLDTDIKAWISMDDGSNYEQITGLSIIRTDGTKKLIRGDKSSLTARNDKKMKLKITTHNGKYVAVYSVGFGVRYI